MLLTAVLAGLPLLALVGLFLAAGSGWSEGGHGDGCSGRWRWPCSKAVTWHVMAAPVREMMRDLESKTRTRPDWPCESCARPPGLCQAERERTAELLEDLSSSLGDGLLVVTSDLEIRLINPVALRFCGVRTVSLGTHLLEILRDPEVVDAVKRGSRGCPDPVVIENPRGLWEVHAFPVRGGGAVVLFTDVSLVRRAAEFRRRFVQDLTHELRSPLTVLRTTVEALEDEVEPGWRRCWSARSSASTGSLPSSTSWRRSRRATSSCSSKSVPVPGGSGGGRRLSARGRGG